MFTAGVAGLGIGAEYAHRLIGMSNMGIKLGAVCDNLDERLDAIKAEIPGLPCFTDFHDLVSCDFLDAVIIAVPHDLHAPMSIAAMEAGRHVLVEKPMARNSVECRAMIDCAGKTGKTLMVAQNWRYTPWVRKVRHLVRKGELGKIMAVTAEWLQDVTHDIRPGNWLLDGTRAGGGPLISLMVHPFDALRYIVGEPASASAICRHDHPAFKNNAEHWACGVFSFQDGTIGTMITSYSASPPQDCGEIRVYGEKGTIVGTDHGIRFWDGGRGTWESIDLSDNCGLPTSDPMQNEILHFADCVRTGAEPLSSGTDNILSIRFIEAIRTPPEQSYACNRRGQQCQIAKEPSLHYAADARTRYPLSAPCRTGPRKEI